MTNIDEIKNAVSKLSPGEFARFRTWFEAFDETCFDLRIESDVEAGKLDKLAEQAATDFRQARTREI